MPSCISMLSARLATAACLAVCCCCAETFRPQPYNGHWQGREHEGAGAAASDGLEGSLYFQLRSFPQGLLPSRRCFVEDVGAHTLVVGKYSITGGDTPVEIVVRFRGDKPSAAVRSGADEVLRQTVPDRVPPQAARVGKIAFTSKHAGVHEVCVKAETAAGEPGVLEVALELHSGVGAIDMEGTLLLSYYCSYSVAFSNSARAPSTCKRCQGWGRWATCARTWTGCRRS